MFWNYTRVGQVARQPCPEGSTGRVSWSCDSERLRFVPLVSPDFSQCRSSWLGRLSQQLDQLLEAPLARQQFSTRPSESLLRKLDEQVVRQVLAELGLMARTRELFGEDLKRIDIMISQVISQLKSLAALYATNGASYYSTTASNPVATLNEQLFKQVANIVSILFDLAQRNAWLELQPAESRKRLEVRFLNHLRDAGLMFASSQTGDQLQEESLSGQPLRFANLVAGVTVISSSSLLKQTSADGTTNEFNLVPQLLQMFANGKLASWQQQHSRFGDASSAARRSLDELAEQIGAEFRLPLALQKELIVNGK